MLFLIIAQNGKKWAIFAPSRMAAQHKYENFMSHVENQSPGDQIATMRELAQYELNVFSLNV